jgi:hypothetical protein
MVEGAALSEQLKGELAVGSWQLGEAVCGVAAELARRVCARSSCDSSALGGRIG